MGRKAVRDTRVTGCPCVSGCRCVGILRFSLLTYEEEQISAVQGLHFLNAVQLSIMRLLLAVVISI